MATPPPARSTPRRIAARAVAAVSRTVGTLLLLCAAALVLVGIGVYLSRQRRLSADERLRAAPRFEDTLGQRAGGAAQGDGVPMPGAATPPIEAPPTPPPTGSLGSKRVADRGLSVTLAPRVVVFGGGAGAAAASATPLRRFGKGAVDRAGSAETHGTDGADGTDGTKTADLPPATPTAPMLPPPDRIVVPSIGVDRPVVPIGWTVALVDNATLRSVWKTADDAAGWHETSAPLGHVGNTVISGHNNIAGAVFKRLHEVAEGDTVTLRAGAAEIRYAVERTFIVREAGATDEERRANNRWIEPTDDERLTLVTCYPPWGNTHRLIVVARPVVYVLP